MEGSRIALRAQAQASGLWRVDVRWEFGDVGDLCAFCVFCHIIMRCHFQNDWYCQYATLNYHRKSDVSTRTRTFVSFLSDFAANRQRPGWPGRRRCNGPIMACLVRAQEYTSDVSRYFRRGRYMEQELSSL